MGGLLVGYGLLQVGRWILAGGGTAFALILYVLAVCSVAAGLGTATWIAVAEHGRSVQELEVHLGRHTLDLVWRRGNTVTDRARFRLRDIGRVDVREVGYQRWHVVARLADGTELTIPMERDPQEAARWLAQELAEVGRDARTREGTERDVPPELKRRTLTTER